MHELTELLFRAPIPFYGTIVQIMVRNVEIVNMLLTRRYIDELQPSYLQGRKNKFIFIRSVFRLNAQILLP